MLKLDDPQSFTGTIKGLDVGDAIYLKGNALADWTGLGNPYLSHAEISNGKLVMTFIDNQANTNASVTESFDLAGNLADHVFTTRVYGSGDTELSYAEASPQVITGVSGQPTDGANPYIDALVNGWAKWNPSAGPITYYFGTNADLDSAVDVHGSNADLTCSDTVIDNWTAAEQQAFMHALDEYSAVTGLTFQEAGSAADANLVFWQKPLSGGAEASSDFLNQAVDGHLWLVFDPTDWNADTLSIGGEGQFTITHEIGHALELAHPHDGGIEPDRTRFPGVGFRL